MIAKGMNSANSRARLAKAERLPRIARLRLMGKTIAEIAAELGVGRTTVVRDLAEVERAWKTEAVQAIDEHKARELARLELIIAEAFLAWEASKQPTERVRYRVVRRTAHGETAEPELESRTVTQRDGNYHFLEVALGATIQRCKILGLEAPSALTVHVREYVEQAAAELGLEPATLWEEIEAVAAAAWERASGP